MRATQHLFSVEEYTNLKTEGRTELIEGIVYDVTQAKDPHRYAVNFLSSRLALAFGTAYVVQVQAEVFVNGWTGRNAPQPDIAVIANTDEAMRHATKKNTYFVLEVSDSTLADDRFKVLLYVKDGIDCLIVNIGDRQVERGGTDDVYNVGETLDISGVTINVSDLFLPDGDPSTR